MKKEHPLREWIDYHSYDYNFSKAKNIILNLNDTFIEQHIELINEFIYHCVEFLSDMTPYAMKTYSDDKFESFSLILEFLCQHPDHKKFSIWDNKVIAVLESDPYCRQILMPYILADLSKKPYKKACHDFFLKQISLNGKRNDSDFLHMSYEKRKESLDYYQHQLNQFYYPVEWKDILNIYPSLLVATLSQQNNYVLNKDNLLSLFNYLSKYCDHSKSGTLSQDYAELLLSSSFFKDSLAPTKNIHLAVAQFLKISHPLELINFQTSRHSTFIREVVLYEKYRVLNYEYKLDKLEQIELMGTHLLTTEAKELFQEQREMKTSNKNHKI